MRLRELARGRRRNPIKESGRFVRKINEQYINITPPCFCIDTAVKNTNVQCVRTLVQRNEHFCDICVHIPQNLTARSQHRMPYHDCRVLCAARTDPAMQLLVNICKNTGTTGIFVVIYVLSKLCS